MNQPFSKRVIFYSSLFITLTLNSAKLLALKKDGVFARLMPFDWLEWLIQMIINFLFCLVIFYYNRKKVTVFSKSFSLKPHGSILAVNLLIIVCFSSMGAVINRMFFAQGLLPGAGYFTKLTLSVILIAIIFRVITALYKVQLKETENQELRNANLRMELELLKSQLNPHFFFNALSSLSGIVRENPNKAQQYIGHLSKIFRYSLHNSQKHLVALYEELNEIYSYAQLIKMRYEGCFDLKVEIDASWLQHQLPPISLQPLLENALKHNIVSIEKPLKIWIVVSDGILEVTNTLQPISFPQKRTGIGLSNLNDRYRILLHKEIEIIRTDKTFVVKLPLK
ncbi:MAG TPA: histidine kinase [Flavitalea sp.]|nr:histidine kinase [Flavitalea sp.]